MLAWVVLASLLPLCFAQTSPWVGTWTDTEFGKSIYICVDGENLFGFYSEVGIMRGTVSGNLFTGYWYEGGGRNSDGQLTYGIAVLQLGSKNTSFSGSYTYSGNTTQYTWTSKKSNSNTPTYQQCFWSNTSRSDYASLAGVWATTTQTLSLCDAESSSYFGTVTSTNIASIFTTGLVADNVYRGEFFTYSLDGTVLIASYGDDQIGVVTWGYAALTSNVNLTSIGHSYYLFSPVLGASADEEDDCLSYWA